MRVLLLSPPYLPEYMRNARCDYISLSHTQWYPIWLSYCGALLEKHGHEVRIIDGPASNLSREAAMRESVAFRPEWTVVYSSTKSEASDISFAERLKELTESRLVFVGPFVSINPSEILENSARTDCAVKGEFDFPVLELVSGMSFTEIRNLCYTEDGKIVQNELRPLLTRDKLDGFPFVTDFYRRHLNLRNYQVPQELFPFVDLFTGRGCAWGVCNFCLWVHSFIPGRAYNTRSIENVIEELRYIKKEVKEAREVFIQDDTLPGERAIELSQAILEAGLDMTWSCYLRGEADFETLKLMKKAGCRTVHVGFESSNNGIIKRAGKGLTAETMAKFTEDANRAGLLVHGDFIFGFPGETRETIKETIRWAKGLNLFTAQFSLINLYPKMPLYEYLKRNNFLEDGEPSYPHLSSGEIRKLAKQAYGEYYLSWQYLRGVLRHPRERFFSQLHPIYDMFKAIFIKRW